MAFTPPCLHLLRNASPPERAPARDLGETAARSAQPEHSQEGAAAPVSSSSPSSLQNPEGAPKWEHPGAEFAVASEDGRELYAFTAAGRHERTLAALTGAVRYAFGYDARGDVTTVTDVVVL